MRVITRIVQNKVYIVNNLGMTLIEILVGLGIMSVGMLAFTSMQINQIRETRAIAENMATLDLQKNMINDFADGSVCTALFTTNAAVLNFDSTKPFVSPAGGGALEIQISGTPGTDIPVPTTTNLNSPILLQKNKIPSPYASTVVISRVSVQIVSGPAPGSTNGPNQSYHAQWVVSFDSSKSIRPLKNISSEFDAVVDTTNKNIAKITSCKGSGSLTGGMANYLSKWTNSTSLSFSKIFEDPTNGNLGVGTTTPSQAFEVNGSIKSQDIYLSSDKNLKKNIVELEEQETVENIKKLRPVEFKWKKTNESDIGVIAQDLQKVYPKLVLKNPEGTLSVKSISLIAPLIKTSQYLLKENEALKKKNEELEERLKKLESK